MLSKTDIAMMTDGQREILYAGMEIGMHLERQKILSTIKNMGEAWETVIIQEVVDELEYS